MSDDFISAEWRELEKGLVEDQKVSYQFEYISRYCCHFCYVNQRPWLSLRPEFSSTFLAFTESLLNLVL